VVAVRRIVASLAAVAPTMSCVLCPAGANSPGAADASGGRDAVRAAARRSVTSSAPRGAPPLPRGASPGGGPLGGRAPARAERAASIPACTSRIARRITPWSFSGASAARSSPVGSSTLMLSRSAHRPASATSPGSRAGWS
jgi:hypothetical protein